MPLLGVLSHPIPTDRQKPAVLTKTSIAIMDFEMRNWLNWFHRHNDVKSFGCPKLGFQNKTQVLGCVLSIAMDLTNVSDKGIWNNSVLAFAANNNVIRIVVMHLHIVQECFFSQCYCGEVSNILITSNHLLAAVVSLDPDSVTTVSAVFLVSYVRKSFLCLDVFLRLVMMLSDMALCVNVCSVIALGSLEEYFPHGHSNNMELLSRVIVTKVRSLKVT
jgi:hypothetical protein